MPVEIHRDMAGLKADFTIDQHWDAYTDEEHATWRVLAERQVPLLKDRVVPEFLAHVDALSMGNGMNGGGGVPDFRRLNEVLEAETGWTVVAVPGLVPDAVFFDHLANRRFPATCFIRSMDELDYLEEPDVFHDVFGHVPLLLDPVYADYMQEYGKGGLKADGQGALRRLARLYWYTVEFGLTKSEDGLRIFGAGIASSKGETVFALDDPSPNRIGFDLERVMRTDYRIDDFQETYFVIDGFDALRRATEVDFTPIYARMEAEPDLAPDDVLDTDTVLHRGTGRYHAGKGRATA
ncbi:phenylalanine 4-monooxygenase [Thalassobaculum salexigens]|uniref:phenylalanine 4-monooxygenase n=1 Tax=Thalassobaculum salexigens TaxID=455360 RepID=UPI00248EE3EB|nr:phenylalanine 4-monooxygenase [Thalassobaculum salexigens]